MKPDQDNADPEVGPASSDPLLRTSTNNSISKEETNRPDAPSKPSSVVLKAIGSSKDNLIPLTHPPPPPHQQQQPQPSSTQTVSSSADDKQSTTTTTTTSTGQSQTAPNIRLLHPILLKVPMQIRYTVYGALSSALFMVLYNVAVDKLGYLYVPSTLYAGTYLIFIPIQHAMAATMVFGWPDRYLPSLTSNVPIGLTAIALGSYLTAYLDRIDFDETVESSLITMGFVQQQEADNKQKEGGNNEFYTSLFVLIITSLWSFVLSVLVNSQEENAPAKKEL